MSSSFSPQTCQTPPTQQVSPSCPSTVYGRGYLLFPAMCVSVSGGREVVSPGIFPIWGLPLLIIAVKSRLADLQCSSQAIFCSFLLFTVAFVTDIWFCTSEHIRDITLEGRRNSASLIVFLVLVSSCLWRDSCQGWSSTLRLIVAVCSLNHAEWSARFCFPSQLVLIRPKITENESYRMWFHLLAEGNCRQLTSRSLSKFIVTSTENVRGTQFDQTMS